MPLTPEGNPCCAGAFGRATSSRFLIVGPERPSKQKPPSGSAALLFFRPAAGAPRRLRQRYASGLVERFAHDRGAVVLLVEVFVVMRAMFLYYRAIIGSRAYRVSVSRVYKRAILSYVLLLPQ